MVGAVLAPIAAILAGLASGASERTLKNKQKEDDFNRQLFKEVGVKRAMEGDTTFLDNPAIAQALGKDATGMLGQVAQMIAQQKAQAEAGNAQAREAFFPGGDPFAGMTTGKRGATMAGVGGGPTITGGPGGAVSVQQPGTGRTIPSLAPQTPEAALAQSVTGPAAGPADEGTAPPPAELGQAVPAAIPPPQGAPAAPTAAPPRPLSGMERLQQSLPEGVTVMPKVGDLSTSVRGLSGEDIGRKIIADGVTKNEPADDILIRTLAAGGKVPEGSGLKEYGKKQWMERFRKHLGETAGDPGLPTLLERRRAAFKATMESGGGEPPDSLKADVGWTKEDERDRAALEMDRALQNGLPFPLVKQYLAAKGMRATPEDHNAAGREFYTQTLANLKAQFPNKSPEELMGIVGAIVPEHQPAEDRKAVREFVPSAPETQARQAERGLPIPRMGDAPGGGASLAESRKQVEQEKIGLAGQQAESVKTGQENVPIRPSAEAIKMEAIHRTAIELGDEITKNYAKMEQNFGGPFGIKSRITAGKLRLDMKGMQAIADLRTTVNVLKAQVGRAEAGASIGPSERELYFKALPDIDTQSSVEFKANLKGTLLYIAHLRRSQAIGEKNVGLRSPSGAPEPGAAPGPGGGGTPGASLLERYIAPEVSAGGAAPRAPAVPQGTPLPPATAPRMPVTPPATGASSAGGEAALPPLPDTVDPAVRLALGRQVLEEFYPGQPPRDLSRDPKVLADVENEVRRRYWRTHAR